MNNLWRGIKRRYRNFFEKIRYGALKDNFYDMVIHPYHSSYEKEVLQRKVDVKNVPRAFFPFDR